MGRKFIKQKDSLDFVYPNNFTAEYDLEIIHDINNSCVSGVTTVYSATTVSTTGITFNIQGSWSLNGAEPYININGGVLSVASIHLLGPTQSYYRPWRLVHNITSTGTTSTNVSFNENFTVLPSELGLTGFTSGTYYSEIRMIGKKCVYPICYTLQLNPTPPPTPTPTPVTPTPTPVTPTPTPVTPTPTPVTPTPTISCNCEYYDFTISALDVEASYNGTVYADYFTCDGEGAVTATYTFPGAGSYTDTVCVYSFSIPTPDPYIYYYSSSPEITKITASNSSSSVSGFCCPTPTPTPTPPTPTPTPTPPTPTPTETPTPTPPTPTPTATPEEDCDCYCITFDLEDLPNDLYVRYALCGTASTETELISALEQVDNGDGTYTSCICVKQGGAYATPVCVQGGLEIVCPVGITWVQGGNCSSYITCLP
jgi:hypothetical protein